MDLTRTRLVAVATALTLVCATASLVAAAPALRLNDREYFELPGLNVMAFQDIYPEGHQGGVGIIQNGVRVATNGDLRLEATPGQWSPTPVQLERVVDRKKGEIVATLAYPDPSKDRKGFNPIEYPDLKLKYKVTVKPEGAAVRVRVDLEKPLPKPWIGKVGFNMELYPTALFGKAWYLGDRSGIFPRQPNGPVAADGVAAPYATGKRLVIAPEVDAQRMVIETRGTDLQLLDGRAQHNNGWFIVRSLVPEGAAAGAIEWLIAPHALPGFKARPVVHVSQVGYHPDQPKIAVIELDAADRPAARATLIRMGEDGRAEKVLSAAPRRFGPFLRFNYLQLDFSSVKREGVYVVEYGTTRTEPFRIARDIYKRHVWQPTLEYFLPVQMCHMRVTEKYRVWHGLCHMDDALMAPINRLHHDGYVQGDSTLTKYRPGDPIPGANVGGWHDAGDDDLRVESQTDEIYILSLMREAFDVNHDNTLVDQRQHLVELRQPDGKPDLLQQIEHGALQVIGVYRSLGRLYRGMISPTVRQYVMMGDVAHQTDNLVFDPKLRPDQRTATHSGLRDDRLIFTEKNPGRVFGSVAGIAAASRALRGYNDALASDCLRAAEALWHSEKAAPKDDEIGAKIVSAAELLLATQSDAKKKAEYRAFLLANADAIRKHIAAIGWVMGRALPVIGDTDFTNRIREAVAAHARDVMAKQKKNPFGVPYEPVIWGAGWGIQKFGVDHYFLHVGFPDLVPRDHALNALNFVLGCHPGENTASFASGVGARSMTTAYGYNRADWSYIPGGVVSGTNLVRPDFPELKDFPYLWQQAEYVIGGGATHMMFLVLAADHLLTQGR